MTVYRSVIIAKPPVLGGALLATYRQRLNAFIRRSERSRFVQPNQLSFAELCHTADGRLLCPAPNWRGH